VPRFCPLVNDGFARFATLRNSAARPPEGCLYLVEIPELPALIAPDCRSKNDAFCKSSFPQLAALEHRAEPL
jgi:hypothetical protein